jgi:hypothetical protein
MRANCQLVRPVWLVILGIAGAIALAGCGVPYQYPSQYQYQQPLQISKILWSSSGWMALETTRPSIAILGTDGSLKRTIPYATPFSWCPSGRYLLYRQMTGSYDPDNYSYQYQLGYFDCVSNSVTLSAVPPQYITRAFWYRSDTAGYFMPRRGAHHVQYAVHVLDESGKETGQFAAPQDLVPSQVVNDLRNDRLFCSASAYGRSGINRYFYFIQEKHFRPLVNAEGYDYQFAYAPARDLAAIAAVDEMGVLHRIDTLDLTQSSPSPHTLIAEARLPKRCYLAGMALSSDGSHLAVALATQNEHASIYVYDIATGRLVKIGQGAQPAFSPDGKQIAFVNLGDEPYFYGTGVYVCNLDGSGMHEIYDEATIGEKLASFLRKWFGLVLILIVTGTVAARIRAKRRASARNSSPLGL